MSTLQGGPGTIVTEGLVLYLDAANYASYTSGSNTWYDLAGSNNGTLTNGPTFSSGNAGSIVFDGVDDYGDLGNLTFLNNTTNATWEFWAFIDTEATQMPISQWNGSTSNIFYVYFNGSDTIRVAMNSAFVFTHTSTGLNTTGSWRHYIITFDGSDVDATSRVKVYINGTTLPNSDNGPISLGAATSNFNIGRREVNGGQFYFNGKISSLKIYNQTLTPQEVLQNYNALKGRFGL